MKTLKQDEMRKYAEVALKVGLNLQPGQKLIMQALKNGGVPIQSAPLIREISAAAYRLGSPLVDVLWRDDELNLIRFQHAPEGSFEEFPAWQAEGILEVIENGGAMLSISAIDPDLMAGQDPALIDLQQKTIRKYWKPISEHIGKNTMNWTVLSTPVPGWARKVFPELPSEEQVPALWESLLKICRIDRDDPLAAWEQHIRDLKSRADYLTGKGYKELHYSGPGTDLNIVLPDGHNWKSAGFETRSGIPFTANIPTEEVFTLPDTTRTSGTVSSTRPLAYAGNVIDEFKLVFKDGKVVDYSAEKGEKILGNLLEIDEGSSRLGEVALVPNSSPISQSGLLFFNTLLDENASCHLALGSAYQFNLDGGEGMDQEEFASRGGNVSLIHEDIMIGSGKLDVDGVLSSGNLDPILRNGEWVF